MMKMKALGVAALACALAVPAIANAQGAPAAPAAPAAHAKGQHAQRAGLAKLVKELNLTPEQQAKLKPIVKDQRTKAKAIHDDKALAPAARKAKMLELRKDSMKQIMAVLTPEQQTKLKTLIHERQNPAHGKHAGKHGGASAPAAGTTAKP